MGCYFCHFFIAILRPDCCLEPLFTRLGNSKDFFPFYLLFVEICMYLSVKLVIVKGNESMNTVEILKKSGRRRVGWEVSLYS